NVLHHLAVPRLALAIPLGVMHCAGYLIGAELVRFALLATLLVLLTRPFFWPRALFEHTCAALLARFPLLADNANYAAAAMPCSLGRTGLAALPYATAVTAALQPPYRPRALNALPLVLSLHCQCALRMQSALAR